MTVYCKKAITYLAKQKNAMKCFELLLFKWPIINEIVNVLKLPFGVTNFLQYSTFTLSDFYGSWLTMKRNLEKLLQDPNALCGFAQMFAEKVDDRNSILLNNTAMICAVYLDPRYKFKLTSDEVQIAKTSMETLLQRIKMARESQTELSETEEEDSFETDCVASGMPRAYFSTSKNLTGIFDSGAFDNLFDIYVKVERMHRKFSLLEFWNERKEEDPILYEIACIIHSIPPTQATVERAFSTLGYIYNPRRTRLSPKMLEEILLIRLNKDLVEPINRQDLKAFEKKSNAR